MSEDLTLLIEQHQKEIWEWKQKESQWIRDKNQLDGNKRIVVELSNKIIELGKANLVLKKRTQEAEGETILVKGIGMNSPEMKALQARVKQLEKSLTTGLEINESHQRYNGNLQVRLSEALDDNKRLSAQIADMNKKREFGDGTY